MASRDVEYEWKTERIDASGDIIDSSYHDRLADAVADSDGHPIEGQVGCDVCLMRSQYSHEGVTCRSYAYIVDNGIEPVFDDGKNRVPSRYLREVASFFYSS